MGASGRGSVSFSSARRASGSNASAREVCPWSRQAHIKTQTRTLRHIDSPLDPIKFTVESNQHKRSLALQGLAGSAVFRSADGANRELKCCASRRPLQPL